MINSFDQWHVGPKYDVNRTGCSVLAVTAPDLEIGKYIASGEYIKYNERRSEKERGPWTLSSMGPDGAGRWSSLLAAVSVFLRIIPVV